MLRKAITDLRRRRAERGGREDSLIFRFIGGAIALSGLAHFATPGLFHWALRWLFGDDTEKQVRINGVLETTIGAAVANRHTRVVGFAGLAAYAIYLGDRIFTYGRRRIQGDGE